MNLLVTNTRNPQAYAIIRALRPYVQKMVATMYGKNRLAARLSHAANSRLVDKRYYVPSPVEDWRAGKIQKENTEREEAYIQAVLKICEEEKIDAIFPSFDPQVYVFSKNKERFERLGILIPIPDYEVVITPLDKYRTIKAAQEVGFPCPKTYLPESEKDLRQNAEELGFPLMVKPRFSAAGRGMGMVRNFSELMEKTRVVSKTQGVPLIQEYIPGGGKQMFHLVLDRKGESKVAFCIRRWRNFLRVSLQLATADECIGSHAYHVADAARLVQKLGWWGVATVEMKVDSRDGIPKLMEINPRLGMGLWYRTELGINEPLMCLKVAKGEEVEAVKNYPVGTMLLRPVEDIMGFGFKLLDLLIYKFRIGIKGKIPLDPLNPPMSLRELIQSYKQTYLGGKKKVFNPYFRYFFQDPLVSVIWWFQSFAFVFGARNELGK
jgi:predicted ATP-grasp superfamily ATP-dependent carboligase